ncbi:CLUMA_CG019658, isoform A [Clunio marinus]|uniref:CLUMA_CG019658, isoform A n=1 Tax=Clunio marinus TaxID=568069 RepID=A0A1J1J4J3_9DIPT|nr:CLUMA_CG019658, isoform A [Clunio marinus]
MLLPKFIKKVDPQKLSWFFNGSFCLDFRKVFDYLMVYVSACLKWFFVIETFTYLMFKKSASSAQVVSNKTKTFITVVYARTLIHDNRTFALNMLLFLLLRCQRKGEKLETNLRNKAKMNIKPDLHFQLVIKLNIMV